MLEEREVLNGLAKAGIKAEAVNVKKDNDVVIRGICVGDGVIRPTLYLEFYTELDEFIEDAIRALQTLPEYDASLLRDYEYIKDKTRIKLMKNPCSDLTMSSFCDLKMSVYIKLDKCATVNVRHEMFKNYGQKKRTFFKQALENTAEHEKAVIFGLSEMIKSMTGIDTGFPVDDVMYVLTNESKLYGSSALLYFKDLPDQLYMLPSSVHETILIYPVSDVDPDKLSEMVRDVNDTSLEQKEVMSDHAYYYDHGEWSII